MKLTKGLLFMVSMGAVLSACNNDDEQVTPGPVANFTYTTAVCGTSGCDVTFTNTSSNASTFTWNFGDNTADTVAAGPITHTYAQPGYYTVKLTASGNGQTSVSQQMVAVGVCNYTVVQVDQDITSNTTWEECKLYLINDDITVSSSLTIQPGAIVKFKPGTRLTVSSTGTVNATGNTLQPVIFTSYKDDQSGGDTNSDNNASQPGQNDWVGITLDGAIGSTFKHCKFMYGASAMEMWNARATVENCTFAHNNGGSPTFNGALSAKQAKSGTVIKNNTFYGNQMPLSVNTGFSVDNTNTFHNPANTNQKNTHNGIWLVEADEQQNITLAETEVPFVNSAATIGVDRTITLAAGVIIKNTAGAGYQLGGNGSFQAQGTAANPVIFTSYLDDAHGGDTNANGTASQPAARDWNEINLNGTSGSVFNYCHFMYGGNAAGSAATLSFSAGSKATVTNSVFAYNFGGSNTEYSAALDASHAETGTIIKNNVFYANVRPLSISPAFDLDNSNTFHNPANTSQRNTYDAIVTNWQGATIDNALKWEEDEVAFTTFYTIDVPQGKTLEVGDGVVIKFNSETHMILRDNAGQLIGYNRPGVFFTSENDDTVGGDSNGNGSLNGPSTGDWEGIYVDDSPGVWLTYPNIRFDEH